MAETLDNAAAENKESAAGKKERLRKAVDFLRLKYDKRLLRDFAEFAEMDRSSLSSAMNGNTSYLTDSFLYKFSNRFPEISAMWLVRGDGEMLASGGAVSAISQSNVNSTNTATVHMGGAPADGQSDSFVNGLLDIIRAKDEQIRQLLSIVEKMQKTV